MRGSPSIFFHVPPKAGIIPAHAGLTPDERPRLSCDRDHPRACGAHSPRATAGCVTKGSSPRMRGSHRPLLRLDALRGIIPAHAGLTGGDTMNERFAEDHPRACGAHEGYAYELVSMGGSSPRMRGSLIPRKEEKRNEGIIPAHAGLTSRGFSAAWQTGDHPRACGAHSRRLSAPTRSSGSSPRMRGSHRMHIKRRGGVGIIPAHAGLTRRVRLVSS